MQNTVMNDIKELFYEQIEFFYRFLLERCFQKINKFDFVLK